MAFLGKHILRQISRPKCPVELSTHWSKLSRPCTSMASENHLDRREESKQAAMHLLTNIVEIHANENRRTFVLPWADQQAIDTVLYPFAELMAKGVQTEFLLDACLKKENLFRAMTKHGRRTYELLLVFVEYFGMTLEDAIRLFASCCDDQNAVIEETANSVQQRLGVFLGRGVHAGQLRRIVTNCPAVLYAGDAQKMDACLEEISSFFHSAEIRKLIIKSPHICLLNPRELESKYEYIYYHMGIEAIDLVESDHWMDMELEQIMARHQLVSRTGKYFFPDPKKPQYKKENPTVKQLFDSSDQDFAAEVAGVSHEEWMVFQQVCDQRRQLEDKEVPYERIKPSKRKAYERRLKEAREAEEGEIGTC